MQLREKECSTYDYVDLARQVHIISKRHNVPLIIDDRIDVALAVNAAGIHLVVSDMPINIARKLMGNKKIIGATTKTVLQAKKLMLMGLTICELAQFFRQKQK